MDISDLDCPQYVKFPIDELSYSMEDSLNIGKHVEDSCADLSVLNDEEESYIFIEDSSHTENSISENEECTDQRHEMSSEGVEGDKAQIDVSDHFVSAIGSSFEENSCTEEDTIVPKSEAHSENIQDNNIRKDVFDRLDCMIDSDFTASSCAESKVSAEHVKAENIQNDVVSHLNSMVDSVSEAVSYEGSGASSEPSNNENALSFVSGQSDSSIYLDAEASSKTENALSIHVHSVAASEPIHNESTLNSVSDQDDCSVYLDAEASSKTENALSAHVKPEDHPKHAQSDVFDLLNCMVDSVSTANSCAGFEADSDHIRVEKVQSEVTEQCHSMVDIVSEVISCEGSGAGSEPVNNEKTLNYVFGQSACMVDLVAEESFKQENSLSAHIECEVQSEHVEDVHMQSNVFDNFDSIVDSASEAISCLGSGADSEPNNNEKSSLSAVFDQSDSGVDLDSETSSGAVNVLADHVESELQLENVQDEIMKSSVFSQLDELVSTSNSRKEDNILIFSKSEVHSEHVKDNKMQSDVFDHLDCMVDSVSMAISCAGSETNSGFAVNEKIQSIVSDSVDIFPEESCCVEDAFVVHSKTDRNSGQIENAVIHPGVSYQADSVIDSNSKDSCEMDAIAIHVRSESNSDLEDINDEIMQREDMDGFCMAIDSENIEAMAVIEAESNSIDLESMEKNNSAAQKNQECDISKVSSESKGAISKSKQNVYIPLAQQVAAFQQKCPERYLSSHVKNFQSTKNWAPPKYIPKSPKLHSSKRHREIKTNIEDSKRYEFHARPFNPKIFEKPKTLETEKLSTQPKSFSLKTAQRAEAHAKNENLDAKKNDFHARPVPKSCHLKQNEPEKVKTHTTKPKSPNFALKSREEKWTQRSTKTNEDPKPSSHKMCPKQPKQVDLSQSVLKHEKKPIEILPFSFEEREKARMALKQQKSQYMEKENMKPGFKAREMPSFKQPALPSIQRKPTTQPAPFTFLSESRISNQKGDTTIADKSSFKTHSDNVLKTINPKKVLSLAETKEFQLHTEKRAKEWKQIEEVKKAEEMEKQRALEAYKAAKEYEEQREVLKMRQNAVHKANPIRAYKKVEIKPCNLVTQPFTPKFETDKRLQSRLEKTEIHF